MSPDGVNPYGYFVAGPNQLWDCWYGERATEADMEFMAHRILRFEGFRSPVQPSQLELVRPPNE